MNEKKIKEQHYLPRSPLPAGAKEQRWTENERQLQDCSKLVLAAKLKIKKGQIDAAYKELAAAIGSGIRHSDVYYMFGEVNRLKGLMDDSVKYLTEALRFQLHSPYTYYSLGLAYAATGEHTRACDFFTHFLNLIETPDAHFELAKSLTELKNHVDGLVHLTRAIELDPNNAVYYAYRGEIYEARGFLELAQKDFRKALQVDYGFLRPYYEEADRLEKADNHVMAKHIREFINKILNAQ